MNWKQTRFLVLPLFLSFIFLGSPLWAQGEEDAITTEVFGGDEVVANEALVKIRSRIPEAVLQIVRDHDVDNVKGVGGIGVHRIHSRSEDVATLISNLSRNTNVLYVEPNYIVYNTAVPNDPSFGQLWGLDNRGQNILGAFGTPGADISAEAAWDLSTGSTDNVVTVIDTGIDYTHPDLAANVWSAPGPFSVVIGGTTINCAAGTHGFNAINNTCNPMDDNDHGTHCSGTIGAVGDNGIGIAGVNWTTRIMGSKFLNANGSGTTAGAINAIEFAIQAKQKFAATSGANVRVLSNSWGGGGFSQALLDEINRANANNMLFVAASGNNSSNNDNKAFYPASYNAPNLIAVAATDNKDNLASFSNYGANTVELGAPGASVLSSVIGGGYAYFNGTSMATPHVSGAAALILSLCNLNTADLISDLLDNVDPISSLTTKTITGGRLNVNNALNVCSGSPPVPPTPDFSLSASPTSRSIPRGKNTNYTISVTPSGGFNSVVTLNVTSGLPSGAGASFSPSSVTGSGSSSLTVTTSSSTPKGTYTLNVRGTSGSLIRNTTVSLKLK